MYRIERLQQRQAGDAEQHNIQNQDGLLFCPPKTCDSCKAHIYPRQSCQCKEISERRQLLNGAEIPVRYLAATLDAIEPRYSLPPSIQDFYRSIEDWQEDVTTSVGMLISGAYGVGKTFAMAALLRQLTLKALIPCRIIHWKPFLAQIRATFGKDSATPEVVGEVHNTMVVVLDDVGPASRTEWDRQILDDIISARYNAMLPTFITTNMSIKKGKRGNSLLEWAWEHTISRLYEMCQWITVDGPDWRARASNY